jgi:hypothetical protein
MNNQILYCFITHKDVVELDKKIIADMCIKKNVFNFIIVCGGSIENVLIDNVLYLNCNDSYEGLPDKIHKMFKYVSENLPEYKTYIKLDRLTKIILPIDFDVQFDYFGVRHEINDVNRKWHINKCSLESIWNNKSYEGDYVPWCNGPAYFLSNHAAKIISNTPSVNLDEEIYEDLYIAKILNKFGITPTNFINIQHYFKDLG